MKFFMNFAKMRVGDMGVDLSGGYIGMAKKGLNRTEVGAVH